MAGFYSGQHGLLKIKTEVESESGDNSVVIETIIKVQQWQMTMSQAVLETTTLADTDRTLIQGNRSASGSATILYYDEGEYSSPTFSNSVTKLIETTVKEHGDVSNTQVTLQLGLTEFREAENISRERFFEVDAYLTSIAMNMAVGEVFSANITFEVTGAINNQGI
jgi:hypothetical protein